MEMSAAFSLGRDLRDLDYTQYGKPYYKNSDFNFNISHSGKYVVCAGSNQSPIGVDVEEIKPINIEDFREQFHPDELKEIIGSSNPLTSFYQFWTKKESVIKADGKGLSIPLNDLNLLVNSDGVKIDKVDWNIQEIHLEDDCICNIACQACQGVVENNST